MKKFFICAAVAAASIFGIVKANDVNTNNLANLQMDDVEMLAEGEGCTVYIFGWVLYCVDTNGTCFSYSDGTMSINCVGHNR